MARVVALFPPYLLRPTNVSESEERVKYMGLSSQSQVGPDFLTMLL